MADHEGCGATGNFPHGKMSSDDDGELQIDITHDSHGRVIFNFGDTAVNWFALYPAQAIKLAMAMLDHAHKAGGGSQMRLKP